MHNHKAVIALPPHHDTETEILAEFGFAEPDELLLSGQKYILPEGFSAQAKAVWIDEGLLSVSITVSALIEAECARCLKPVSLEISGKLRYLYYLQETGAFEDDEYMPVEIEYFGRVLDIMPQIEESIYTLIPTKILCREDCKGLCPDCGKDLNDGECSCTHDTTDPRLSALRNFVSEQPGGKQ